VGDNGCDNYNTELFSSQQYPSTTQNKLKEFILKADDEEDDLTPPDKVYQNYIDD
jgi:hypothetical protein